MLPVRKSKKAVSEKADDGHASAIRKAREKVAQRVAQIEQVVEAAPSQAPFDLAKARERVNKVIKFSTFEQQTKYILQTGSRDLNRVVGAEDVGIPYGRVVELNGLEHGGKTLISNILLGMAQRDGAAGGIMDVEDSADEIWSRKLGVDWENTILIKTKLILHNAKQEAEDGTQKKKKTKMKSSDPLRPEGAEELFAEMEAWMAALYEQGVPKQCWVIDSLANLITVKQLEAGTTEQSMNTKLDLPVVLAKWLPKLSGLASNYNALIIVINQLRNKIGIVYGDPYDTPGGRAARHAFANRTRVKRLKGGMLKQSQRVVGIVGVLSNQKNKMGHGSRQSEQCGFKVSWLKPNRVDYKFMSVKEATELLGGE